MTTSETKFKETEIGLIPEEWEVSSLGESVDIIDGDRGANYPNGDDFSTGGYCLFLNTKNVSGDTFDFSNLQFISREKDEMLRKGKLKRGDFVLTTRGTVGNIAFYDDSVTFENIRINSGMVILRNDEYSDNFNSPYLYQLLKSKFTRDQFLKLTTGSAQPQLPIRDLKNLKLIKPPIDEQEQIAEILSSLDDKIELNRKINANLEKFAGSLFKKWFVDIGDELPEGWRMGKISDVADISIGRTPPRMEKEWFSENPKDVKWISIRDLGNSGVYVNKTAEYLTREAVERFNIPVIPKNTVILSFKLTVGRVAITTEEMLSNEAIAHIKLTDKNTSPEYIYLFLKSFDFSSLGSTSSIATAVNSKSVKEIPITIPDEKTGNDFAKLLEPIFESILGNTKQVDALSKIRDSLLPRLMSGKIRI